jgi:hypothetical protein
VTPSAVAIRLYGGPCRVALAAFDAGKREDRDVGLERQCFLQSWVFSKVSC